MQNQLFFDTQMKTTLKQVINWSWRLPEQELEDQFSLGHVSTAASPRNQGVFVEGTNEQVQCIS